MNRRAWFGFIIILTAPFLAVLDFFIVNIAIPTIKSSLGATPGETELLVAGYGLAYATLVITGGRLGDLYGRKRAFVFGMVAFTIASTLCGLSVTPGMLIMFRFAQGMAAALMVPQALAVMHSNFPEHNRNTVFGIYGTVLGLAAVSGQLLSGEFLHKNVFNLGWRAIFFVNIPVGVLAVLLAIRFIDEGRSTQRQALDIIGVILSTTALAAVIYSLTMASGSTWELRSTLMVALAVVAFLWFMLVQRQKSATGRFPLIHWDLLTSRKFVLGLLSLFFFAGGLSSLFLTLTIHLQEILHLSPVQTGFTFAPYAVAFSVSSLLSIRFAAPFGRRGFAVGLLIMLAGLIAIAYVFSKGTEATSTRFLPWILCGYGIGQGCAQPLLFNHVLSAAAKHHAGAAAGILSTVQQLAGAVGVAAIGFIYYNAAQYGIATPIIGTTCVNIALIVIVLGLSTLFPARFLTSTIKITKH